MSPAFRRSAVKPKIGLALAFVAGLLAAVGLAGCSPEATRPRPVSVGKTPASAAPPPAPSEPAKVEEAVKAPQAQPRETPPSVSPAAPEGSVTFKLQPRQGVMGSLVNYYRPLRVALSEKPDVELKKEPRYTSPKPLYGTLKLGEGPDSRIILAVDEAEGQKPRMYIDRNNDGDLTNDGSGEWTNDSESTLSLSGVVIDVPYGTARIPYTFQFYRFKTRLREFVLYYRDAGREGEITSDGKTYKVLILDENADGRFDDLANGTLIIDLNQDGKLVGESDSAEHHKLGQPFNIHGKVWAVASVSPDGTSISLRPSDAKVEMQAYLEPGYPAPKFTAKDLDDKPVDLAEEAASAKYVLLDFWASWCGPCRAEFPHLRQLQARYKNHGLRIVGVNLDDERDKAVQAATENKLDYRHVFDGGGWKNAVAVQYRVHGIPETCLLDRELKILAKGLRGSQLEARLAELLGPGDSVPAATASSSSVSGRSTDRVPPASSPSETNQQDQVLAEANDSELSEAAFALFAAPDFLSHTKPLAAVLQGPTPGLRVARAGTLRKAIDSRAEVAVLLLGHMGPAHPDEETVALMKRRKVIGIGDGAADLFGLLGLEIRGGGCATVNAQQLTVQTSGLLGEPEQREPVTVFEKRGLSEPPKNRGLYIPAKSELRRFVDVIARCSDNPNYAPICRQGNCLLLGVMASPSTWSPAFADLFRRIAVALHSRQLDPFTTAKWEITKPGTYKFSLGRAWKAEELSDRNFYFQFAKPTALSARLEHTGSWAMMLMLNAENGRRTVHHTRRDAQHGESLDLACDIKQGEIESMRDRYWTLRVTNFDGQSPVDCTLTITCK